MHNVFDRSVKNTLELPSKYDFQMQFDSTTSSSILTDYHGYTKNTLVFIIKKEDTGKKWSGRFIRFLYSLIGEFHLSTKFWRSLESLIMAWIIQYDSLLMTLVNMCTRVETQVILIPYHESNLTLKDSTCVQSCKWSWHYDDENIL